MASAGDAETFPDSFRDIPLTALRQSSRTQLSNYLNIERQTFGSGSVLPDFNGLAELVDFDYHEIMSFKRTENPTEAILVEWQKRPYLTPTVGKLLDCLRDMGREDILKDCLPLIIKDIKAFLNRRTQPQNPRPVQDPCVTCTPAPLPYYSDHHVDETKYMTVDDVKKGCPQYYDAFVCYNPETADLAFVKAMLKVMESSKFNLKMFVPWRDDLPGSSNHTVSAALIQERCKKMVIIVSYKYLASPACDFQTKFAHSLSPGSRSKKLVPVLIEDCKIPHILRHVTLCDYTKADLKDWFWERLANAIRAPISPEELEYEEDVVLSDIRLDVSSQSGDPWQTSSYS